MLFQHHSFCTPRSAFHADPLPGIFLIRIYACNDEIRWKLLGKTEERGLRPSPKKVFAYYSLQIVGKRKKRLIAIFTLLKFLGKCEVSYLSPIIFLFKTNVSGQDRSKLGIGCRTKVHMFQCIAFCRLYGAVYVFSGRVCRGPWPPIFWKSLDFGSF